MGWVDVLSEAELAGRGRALVRLDGRQILLLKTASGIVACNNRCPHEGYPLSEGSLAEGPGGACVLTCNWHNWKFDLTSGETLVGGDNLRRYPVRLAAGRILLDVTEEPMEARRARVLAALPKALADKGVQRLVRETARLGKIGADPLDAVRLAVDWGHERLEFGMTHAFAAAPDWLAIHDRTDLAPAERLAVLGEILGHVADDSEGHRTFPFTDQRLPWDGVHFLAAVEVEDEAAAAALVRGALAAGLSARSLAHDFAAAALGHYADFGHALIYVFQALHLIDRLGPSAAEPVLLALVRSLVYGSREDLLPEFRDYRARLEHWGVEDSAPLPLSPVSLQRTSAKQAMAIVAAWGTVHLPEQVFATLVETVAWQLLHADADFLRSPDQKLSENVGWLDFSHGLTFAAAGLEAIDLDAGFWPALLLQMACFVGRNGGYVDAAYDAARWQVEDPARFLDQVARELPNHDRERFIISCHLVKTRAAVATLADRVPSAASTALAALNRLLHEPMRLRHPLRVAQQMYAFVSQE